MKQELEELNLFLENNMRISYFYYMQRGNGMLQEKKEYHLDLLLKWIFRTAMIQIMGIGYNSNLIEKLMSILEMNVDSFEKIALIKKKLLQSSVEDYNEIIGQIVFVAYNSYITLLGDLALTCPVSNTIVNEIQKLYMLVDEEMKSFSNIMKTRIRSID